jgi:ankyrin repeat protein
MMKKIYLLTIIFLLQACGEKVNFKDSLKINEPEIISRSFDAIPEIEMNTQDSEGLTILVDQLIQDSNNTVLEKSLDKGADPNIKTKLGLSPLSIAIQNNNIEGVRLLLKYGANKDEITSGNISLYQLAKKLQREEIMALLLQ